MGFANRMDQSLGNYRVGIRIKKGWWSLFVWMVDVVPHGAWVLYLVNKDEGDESLPFIVFLKSKTNENEKKYKTYKSLFEILKEKSKKIYYSRKLENCKQNMKKTWDTIKQVIGKTKTFKNDIPKKMVIDGDSTNILLKSDLSLHLQSQPLPKFSNSS